MMTYAMIRDRLAEKKTWVSDSFSVNVYRGRFLKWLCPANF